MKKLARIATAVAIRSCATIRYWRGVRADIRDIRALQYRRSPLGATGADSGRSPFGERSIHGGKHLRNREFVEAAAAAVDVAFAPFLLARQDRPRARCRVLDQPDIAAILDGSGGVPRP